MVRIRKAGLQDSTAVFLLAHAFATSFAVEKAAFVCAFDEIISHPDSLLAVVEVEGEVAGYLLGFDHPSFFANGHVAWVEEIMVSETFRRQGIGRKLMEAFELWAIEKEVKIVALATRRAADFYGALGYEESAAYFRKQL
ncbi:MAG: GNAT family N-acetyltransferase [Janthinobacterium lividum]